MVFHTSLSARFASRKRSCRISMSLVRVGHTGITHIIQLNLVMGFEDRWLYMIPRTLWQIYTMLMMVSFHPFYVHALPCDPNRKYRYHALRLVSISCRTERFVLTRFRYHISSITLGQIFTPVVANSTLINGKGRYAGGPLTALSVINVQQGLRYRFRVVSISCDPFFNFTIDGHRMTIIEVDGTEVHPVEVDSIPILSGQRYSVVVTAGQPVGNYWIRSLSNLPNVTFDGGQNMAILRYQGAPEEDPTSDAGPYELSFDEGNLHPRVNPGALGIPEIGKADVNLVLFAGFTSEGYFTLGNVSYVPTTVPVLLQILSGARDASQLLPNGSVYVLPQNKVIEISFPGPNIIFSGPVSATLIKHRSVLTVYAFLSTLYICTAYVFPLRLSLPLTELFASTTSMLSGLRVAIRRISWILSGAMSSPWVSVPRTT